MSLNLSETGGYRCTICGQMYPIGVYHACGGTPSYPPLFTAPQTGWKCPACGNGCAPWLGVCPGPHFKPSDSSSSMPAPDSPERGR
jgi:hypothetical protein